MAAEGNASSSSTATGRGCGLALGRLVRKLRRQSRMMLSTATSSRPPAAARCQYDPLSYARNFDRSGLGDDGGDVSAQLYHRYTFASRFVLSSSSTAARRQPQ
ncbi:uncharacterized protein [Oryza sativa Japonica Group]|jgi:hypothetical protein|uniref:Os06g0666800 protein n=8 Tax=Oryza TaxID=4527 RepID=A3BEF1_ORYSJ|nr:uncharacterized protein LOC4341783 [Oryza sativa Japonica Group]XP_052159963.1 uncharacterized protein LOC127777416 [Oryza glaberrima]EAZ02007.1 hypothetical protein OsI_24038 [Oryza sativa Indica Group]KAB8103458.1 hypothetical protein EE612_035910 [Oryza sativa]EAZ37940.1 hypothetical protein OsJ_22290 [Oryza sativa Japonica Group]KAF2927993.1 hypothetical protein DAI22_06g246000 [Oryza sativa Japonica Group]BAD45407.1 unknown protein [Oryza sativa Japonica Group]|eukprot:NP_001058310.1 Os06g0666800 [Oryza sativa Japonica Group]